MQSMNFTAPSLLHLNEDLSYLSLQDAAYARHRALRHMLSFLAAIPDHGTPSAEVLAGAFSCLEYLADDAARLYEAAETHARAKHT